MARQTIADLTRQIEEDRARHDEAIKALEDRLTSLVATAQGLIDDYGDDWCSDSRTEVSQKLGKFGIRMPSARGKINVNCTFSLSAGDEDYVPGEMVEERENQYGYGHRTYVTSEARLAVDQALKELEGELQKKLAKYGVTRVELVDDLDLEVEHI